MLNPTTSVLPAGTGADGLAVGNMGEDHRHRHRSAHVVGCSYPVTCTCGGGSRCVETMEPGEVAVLDEGVCVWLVAGGFGRNPGA